MTAPERVLQFGTGRFLRGFVDAFLDESNLDASRAGSPGHEVTVVESTGSGAAARLTAQACRYRLLVRGLQDGRIIDRSTTVTSIRDALDATTAWHRVHEVAVDPALRFVVSNVTEAGYATAEGTATFPGRLLEVLQARDLAGLPGLVILPCELVERNGDRLRTLVAGEARRRGLGPTATERILDANVWTVTLVDRIVTTPAAGLAEAAGDPLAVAAEPYASWMVEMPSGAPMLEHQAVKRTADVGPFALRKIRLLNGAHTALVARTRDTDIGLVREAMADAAIAGWLEELLLTELVPALGERITDGVAFTQTTLERFRNPFLDHRLADIALHHRTKLETRLLPSYHDHVARFGRRPRLLAGLLATEGVPL